MTADLRAILGDRRHRAAVEKAARAHAGLLPTDTWASEYVHSYEWWAAEATLEAVLPGLLADTWDKCSLAWEEYYSGRTDNVPPSNPYRTETP